MPHRPQKSKDFLTSRRASPGALFDTVKEFAGASDAVEPFRSRASMAEISYRRHRFPPVVIQHAVWLYLRFTLSYRDVEDLLAERGLDISYETVRSWVLKFGPVIGVACLSVHFAVWAGSSAPVRNIPQPPLASHTEKERDRALARSRGCQLERPYPILVDPVSVRAIRPVRL